MVLPRRGSSNGELVEAVDFYFEVSSVGEGGSGGSKGFGKCGGEEGEVVVLGHDGVGEGEAVVLAAPAADGVALEKAEPRGGLAGVCYPSRVPSASRTYCE